MLQAIRATYKDGKLHPLEPLELEEGQTVDIIITSEDMTRPEASPTDDVAENPSLGLVGLLAGQSYTVLDTPFHRLAKLAARSGIEFDEGFHTANPDEIIESEL